MKFTRDTNYIAQEDWLLDYPGALIILRDKRERRFRNMMSGVGDFKEESNAFEDLWSETRDALYFLFPTNTEKRTKISDWEWERQFHIWQKMKQEPKAIRYINIANWLKAPNEIH